MKLEETIRILYDAGVEFCVLPELRGLNEVKKKTGLE